MTQTRTHPYRELRSRPGQCCAFKYNEEMMVMGFCGRRAPTPSTCRSGRRTRTWSWTRPTSCRRNWKN